MDLRDDVILIILAALLVFQLIGTDSKETPINEIEHVDEEDLTVETRVAIYSGQGTWNESVVALERLFLWMNLTGELVDASQINGEGLKGFDIFCVPGGDMYQYSRDISPEGKEKIKGSSWEEGVTWASAAGPTSQVKGSSGAETSSR